MSRSDLAAMPREFHHEPLRAWRLEPTASISCADPPRRVRDWHPMDCLSAKSVRVLLISLLRFPRCRSSGRNWNTAGRVFVLEAGGLS